MAQKSFFDGGYYHIYNRGVEKRSVFSSNNDYLRFLETIDFYRKNPLPMKLSDFRRKYVKIKQTENQKELVKIYCYCLMPNHIHLLVQQLIDGGITMFMRKVSDSYTRYFNTKHDRIGPLFQGTFKAKLIDNEEYLLQVSKYIHRNPKELRFPLGKWEGYAYSSYNYYLSGEKHPFCNTELILSFFSKTNSMLSYESFVGEEIIDNPTLFSLLIDSED